MSFHPTVGIDGPWPALLTLFLPQLALTDDADSVVLEIRLNRVSTQPLLGFRRPSFHQPLRRFATKLYEKCRLGRMALG